MTVQFAHWPAQICAAAHPDRLRPQGAGLRPSIDYSLHTRESEVLLTLACGVRGPITV